jgi:hypothetical protein
MKKNLKVFFVFIIVIILTFSVFPIKGVNNDIISDENEISQITKNLGNGITDYWALIVGVSEYAENRVNERSVEIINEFKGGLLKSPTWSEDHINVITGKNATVRNIIKGLRWLDSKEDSDDISLIYFNCDGYNLPFDIPPRDEEDGRDEFLLTYWGVALYYAIILDDTLNFFLNRLESKGTAVIIDSSHAGGFNDTLWHKKLGNTPVINPKIKNGFINLNFNENFANELRKKGLVMIMSCERYGSPYAFSTYLIDAFRGFGDINQDNIITAEEVFNYIELRMKYFIHKPIIFDDFEGELPLLEISEESNGPIKIPKEEIQIEDKFSELSEDSIDQINFPIDRNLIRGPISQENSKVCGYIVDNKTNDPIQNVNVTLILHDVFGNYIFNYTKSNHQGFYSINVASGEIALIFRLRSYIVEEDYWFDIGENEILWMNKSMIKPHESSKVCGYIRDETTNETIPNANITLKWRKYNPYEKYFNYTSSNSLGFYSINVTKGLIDLLIEVEGYLIENWPDNGYYNISENETKWVNISLFQSPPENSIIKGYITDFETGDPIDDAKVMLYWEDNQGHYQYNRTYSNSLGFYFMNVSNGSIFLQISSENYFSDHWPSYGYYDIGENETKWANVSLIPKPPENSIIKGYITDSETGQPLQNADILLFWEDEQGHWDFNYTYSDTLGFYSMNVAEGYIELHVSKSGYFYNYWPEYGYYFIEENETKWINISLYKIPLENSIIKGYVTDSLTGEPIENASIDLDWEDEQGHYQDNDTFSDSFGFYSMNVAKGLIRLNVYAEDYSDNHTNWFEIDENESIWLNITLNPYEYEYTLYGYIKNSDDNSPIENAFIDLFCVNSFGDYYYEYSYSNESGFYSVMLQAGYIDRIYVYADDFFEYRSDEDYILDEDFVIWINISITPHPPETSKVYGYISDSETNEPVENAIVELSWRDFNENHYLDNITYSNNLGFYNFNVAAGLIYFYIEANGYFDNYFGSYEIFENETLWINISIEPIPPQNAIVCGYIKDVNTDEPLQDVYVNLEWFDFDDFKFLSNTTMTDYNGFYLMNIQQGEIYIEANKYGYLDEYSSLREIYEYQVLWINLSMYPKPPKNSLVKGYIKDSETGEPIENAYVDIKWIGCEWHHDYFGDDETGEDGYYRIDVPAGELYLIVSCSKYHYEEFYRMDISENDTLWFNITLEKKKVDVEILKPASGFYILNNVILPFYKPLIFGNIELLIDIDDCDYLEKLELYIDDELKLNITNEPTDYFYTYNWTRKDIKPFKHEYAIRVVAVDSDGNIDTDEINVTRYF